MSMDIMGTHLLHRRIDQVSYRGRISEPTKGVVTKYVQERAKADSVSNERSYESITNYRARQRPASPQIQKSVQFRLWAGHLPGHAPQLQCLPSQASWGMQT